MKKIRKIVLVIMMFFIIMPTSISAKDNHVMTDNNYNINMILESTDVSDETKEWLLWFDKLSYEEQIAVNYRPAELEGYNYEKKIRYFCL